MNDPKAIMVESKVERQTGEPRVVFRWGIQAGELSPEEAREHALLILAAADAAESDAFIVSFYKRKGQLSLQEAAIILCDFRDWRTERHSRKG